MFKTLKAKVFLAAGVVFGGAAVVTLTIVMGLSSLSTSMYSVMDHYVSGSMHLRDIDQDLREIRYRMAAVSLDQLPATGSANHLKETRVALDAAWAALKAETQQIQYPDEQRAAWAKLEKGLADVAPPVLDKIAAAYQKDDKAALVNLLESDWVRIQVNVLKPMEVLLPYQAQAIGTVYSGVREEFSRLVLWMLAATLGVLILVIGVGWRISRRLAGGVTELTQGMSALSTGNLSIRLRDAGQDELDVLAGYFNRTVTELGGIVSATQQASAQISVVAAALSEGTRAIVAHAENQASRIGNISASMDEISQSTSGVAEMARTAESAVRANESQAIEGNAIMVSSVSAAQRAAETMELSVQAVQRLSAANQKISAISATINEIASQTNLLALNAAIEAARAGEQGRGFAVVADEVRKLAERTGDSTSEIGAVVSGITEEMDRTVAAMRSMEAQVSALVTGSKTTSATLSTILASASEATQLAHQIQTGTAEQSIASQDVASSVVAIAATTEDTLSSVRRMEATVHDLRALASHLSEATQRITI